MAGLVCVKHFSKSVSEDKKNVFMKFVVEWHGKVMSAVEEQEAEMGRFYSFKQGGLGRPHGREPLRKDLKVRKVA